MAASSITPSANTSITAASPRISPPWCGGRSAACSPASRPWARRERQEGGSVMKVGVVGVGIMGSAIARNLVAAGLPVIGYDIAPQPRDALKAMGAEAAPSAAAVAAGADIILTSLPSVAALDATAAAIAAGPRRDIVLAELSTLPIEAKERSRDALAASGVAMLDCPLSGTGAQAVNRDLVVYASGERAAYERCTAVFKGFARLSHYLGDFGNGSRMKFIANLLVAIHNVAS